MSTTLNNNEASSSSTSASNNAESLDLRMKSMEDQINNLSLALTRFMKEPMFSSNTASRSQPSHDNSDTESEQSDNETSNDVDVPTEYQLSDTLLGQYKHMVNNQGLLVEEECILKKEEISEMNKVFNFPSNFSVNVAPFGTPDGISVSSNVKNNDTDLLIVEKRINDSLKPLLLMSSMLSPDNSNVDLELIRYLAESAIVLAVNAQASLSRVRRNNIAKEIYGSEVLLPIKIKDTPKMFDETETERVRKLAKSIRKNNEAKQSLLKMNNHSKSNFKKSVNSSGNNTNGNSINNSKSSSGSNGRSNNFNGSPSNVASGSIQYKHMVNNQGLLVEEECILKKEEISEMNKVFNFPSNFSVNVAPFGTPDGISVSSNVKNNDTDLLIVEKRINDSLKPLLLMSSMLSPDNSNVDLELIRYLAESAIVLAVNAQESLSRVRRNNIAKEIYGSEVLLPIKIKDTPKMFDETETERVRKLAKSIRKNNEAKQSLLKMNNHSKSNFKKSVNSSGNNTNGNSSNNSKSSSGSNGRSNNFNGSPSNVASGSNNTKSASGTNNRFQKNKK
ncbi:hypothetical protein ACTFIZ_007949 [Dictyostelium cf. discoideum]